MHYLYSQQTYCPSSGTCITHVCFASQVAGWFIGKTLVLLGYGDLQGWLLLSGTAGATPVESAPLCSPWWYREWSRCWTLSIIYLKYSSQLVLCQQKEVWVMRNLLH